MNVLSRFGIGRGSLPRNASYRLTQEGEEKLQAYNGSHQSRILSALKTCGSGDRDEIASASGLSRGSVEKHTYILLEKGYVQRVGGGYGGGVTSGMEGDG